MGPWSEGKQIMVIEKLNLLETQLAPKNKVEDINSVNPSEQQPGYSFQGARQNQWVSIDQ